MSGHLLKGILLGGAIVASAFIPGVGALAGGIFKMMLLSVGSSIALNSVTAALSMQHRQGSILAGVIDTQAPLPTVYGRAKVGARYADRRTSGTNNQTLTIVAALCHGSESGTGIEAMQEVYFDDRLAVDPDGQLQSPFIGKLTYAKYLGTDSQTVDPTLNTTFPANWPASSAGRGIAYLVLNLAYDEQVYPSGEPNITVVVKGAKVKDPRNLAAAAAWSTNPGCCAWDLLTSKRYGLGADVNTEMDAASIAALATYCDTSVTKDATLGITGKLYECNGVIDCGQSVQENLGLLLTSCRGIPIHEGGKYRIFTRRAVTPSGFTLNESNLVGAWQFSFPPIADTPNTLEGHYVLPGDGPLVTAIDSITSGDDNLTRITTAEPHNFLPGMIIHLYEAGTTPQGLNPKRLGAYTVGPLIDATKFYTADNFSPIPTGYTANSCRVTPDNLPYSVATRIWPRPNTSNGFLTADNNYEVAGEVSLPFTTDPYTCEQILMVTLKEARAMAVTVTATEAALALQCGDVVSLSHPTPGLVNQLFWVLGVMLNPSTGEVRLALLQYDATWYSLDPLDTIPRSPYTALPYPFFCFPPGDITLESGDSEAETDRDGVTRCYIHATWLPAPEPYLRKYLVDYRKAGTDHWIAAPDNQNQTDTDSVIGPVVEGVDYEVRVRAQNTLAVTSAGVVEQIRPHLDETNRSGSRWLDDFTTDIRRRWFAEWTGVGASFRTVFDPDAKAGKNVGRVTGTMVLSTKDAFPFDPRLVYVAHWRVRQRRAGAVGTPLCSLGFMGLRNVPGQPGNYTHMNAVGQDSPDNQHYVVCRNFAIAAGRDWTDLYAWVKGYAGGKVELQTGQLSHSGLQAFSAANCLNGSIDPANVAFHVDTSVPGAYLHVDFGADPTNWKSVVDARFHMSAAGSVADWDLEFSTDTGTTATNWFKANSRG